MCTKVKVRVIKVSNDVTIKRPPHVAPVALTRYVTSQELVLKTHFSSITSTFYKSFLLVFKAYIFF